MSDYDQKSDIRAEFMIPFFRGINALLNATEEKKKRPGLIREPPGNEEGLKRLLYSKQ